jgi:hypothetical protein
MVQARRLIGDVQGVTSLAQGTLPAQTLPLHAAPAAFRGLRQALPLAAAGAVFWGPPEAAISEAVAHAHEPLYSHYNADEGLPELRAALQRKVEQENGLRGVRLKSLTLPHCCMHGLLARRGARDASNLRETRAEFACAGMHAYFGAGMQSHGCAWCAQYSVMVTAGANQALASLMLTLLDPADKAVLFKPYYFNALMALQARHMPPAGLLLFLKGCSTNSALSLLVHWCRADQLSINPALSLHWCSADPSNGVSAQAGLISGADESWWLCAPDDGVRAEHSLRPLPPGHLAPGPGLAAARV